MKLRKTKIEEINELAKKIAKDKRVVAVYLFGSYSTGKTHINSDIDICVVADDGVEYLWDLKMPKYNSDIYDINLFKCLPLNIKFRVFKEGMPLVIKRKGEIDKIKLKVLREYIDFRPALHRMCMEKLKCTI